MGMISDLEHIKCTGLLEENYVGRLAYIYENEPHVVPSTYFFDKNNKRLLCFASNGHRIHALRQYNRVSFQVDQVESFRSWKSVQVHGIFEELAGERAKNGLKLFVDGVQNTIEHKNVERPNFLSLFSSKLQETDMPVVYSITLTKITGKAVTEPHK
ncbi:pyridoxamine 5'-phosphate oxidase family protein [Pareuzebyella sediminis]|uniref:pyridoxamine 5'-phosphate oxidase family protein n=1 Tax=Pareuzebyella sediminis TaxID=2607998 RepID=UPI0011EC29EF|nr:pyridoxamine 5'-phosphate oxidase family protein [Pareuzebyella sediminis]